MEAYKVWATLNIRGDAHKKMEQFLALVRRTNQEVNRLVKNLRNINGGFNGLSNTTHIVNNEVSNFNITLNQTSVRMSSVTSQANRLSVAIRNINAASAPGGGGRGGRGGFGGRHGLHGLREIGFGSLLGPMGALGSAYYMGGGIAAGAIGAGIVVNKGFQQERQYQKYTGQLEAQGFSKNQISEANALANQVRPGISQVDMMEAIVDAQMATRNFSQAKILAPLLAQGKVSANVLYGGMTHKQEQDLIRVSELAGGSKTSSMANWLNVALQMMATSGGTILPQEQRAFWRQAAGSMSRLTPLGYLSLEPVMQEEGGSKTATALTTGVRAFINPQMAHFARYQTAALQKFGLWDAKTNRMKQSYIDMIQTDPQQFAKAWLSQLGSHGITSASGIQTETLADFPRTFGTLLALMIKNMDKIDRARSLAAGSMSGDELRKLSEKQYDFSVIRLSKAWDTLADSIGKMTSPAVMKGLNFISTSFENLAVIFTKFNTGNISGGLKDVGMNLLKETPIGYAASKIFGWGDVTSANSSPNNQSANGGHVFLDGEKVGKVIFGGAGNWMQTYVQHGMSGVNSVSSPIYPGTNNLAVQGI